MSEPPPELPSKRTIGQAIRTEIDVKWKAPTRIGGSRMKDFERAKANRIAAYDLLHDEPDGLAQAKAEKLNRRTISFFPQLTPEMDLDAVLAMPEKPTKE